jgi:hypothetical protein
MAQHRSWDRGRGSLEFLRALTRPEVRTTAAVFCAVMVLITHSELRECWALVYLL